MSSSSVLPLILIADDRTEDLFVLRRRLDAARIKNPVVTLGEAEQVKSFLRATSVQGTHPSLTPAVLLLDIDLPGGAAPLVEWIRGRPALRALRLVVLSDEPDEKKHRRFEEFGVAHFLKRRCSVDAMLAAVDGVTQK